MNEEGNVGQDLAADMKKEAVETSKYYENVELEFKNSQAKINALLKEKHRMELNEEGKEQEVTEYEVYWDFKDSGYIKIADINSEGKFTFIDKENLKSEEDKKILGDMINIIGQENEVDINKLQDKLKEIEAKTKEELKEKGMNIKDRDEKEQDIGEKSNKDKDEEDKEKDVAELERETEIEVIAKRKHIDPKTVCKIRRDSQFYKNYPHIPKTSYFYLDDKGRMNAEYIDKDGNIQELKGFTEIKDTTTRVTRFGNDGQNITEERPMRVMSADGLQDKNKNTQTVRIAMFQDSYGYWRIETIHQGRNGMWEGKNIDTYGRERNTSEINKITDETRTAKNTGMIAERSKELQESGYSQDGVSLDEVSKKRKIEEYVNEGYTFEEANSIYDYVVGKYKMNEVDAKQEVKEERAKKNNTANDANEENDGGRTQGGDAYERTFNRTLR